MKYRKEIDGLRAIAVIPVILFHAGFKLFKGGFVGVDVFFVISGYLITTIILSDMENRRFSLINFYERRARRILPALFFIMICCLPAAWFWLSPKDMINFSQSIAAVSVFSSNILFWKENSYFGTISEMKPFIHTWSLAVEEQYYLFFPLLLMLIYKLRKRTMFSVILLIGAVSLAAAQWGSYSHSSAAFYLLPTRAWEFAAGALTSCFILYSDNWYDRIRKIKALRESGSITGFIMILYAVFFFSSSTPFPGFYALIPTSGTVLLILFASQKTIVGEILGLKPVVAVGLISYSTYLWHQPLFAFAKHKSLAEPGLLQLAVLSILSFIMAYLSWRFVEKPFRKKSLISTKVVFTFALTGSLLFACAGISGHFSRGFPERADFSKELSESFSMPSLPGCFDINNIHTAEKWYCTIGNSEKSPSYILFGDSHALALYDVFDRASNENGISGIIVSASGSLPFLDIYPLGGNQKLKDYHMLNKRVLEYVQRNSISTVFLAARWSYYTDAGYNSEDHAYIGLSKNSANTSEASKNAFMHGFRKTVEAYKELGVRVIILSDSPVQKIEPDSAYFHLMKFPAKERIDIINNLSVKYAEHKKMNSFVNRVFSLDDYADFIDIDLFMCSDSLCPIGNEDLSFYRDDDHLSLAGADRLYPAVDELIKQISAHNKKTSMKQPQHQPEH